MTTGKELRALNLESLIAEFEQDADNDAWRDFSIEQAACALAERGEEGIQYLVDHYSNADAAHAQAALTGLTFAEPPLEDIADVLTSALDDPREQVVESAIQGLSALRIREPVDRIASYQTHNEEMLRAACFEYFAWVFPPRAIAALDAALADESWRVRAISLMAVNFSEEKVLINAGILRAWWYLDDAQSSVRADANWLLWNHYWKGKTNSKRVKAGRKHPDPRIRASAIRTSLELRARRAPKILPKAFADSSRIVIINALDVMQEIYSTVRHEELPALPDMTPWLTNDDPVIRAAAEEAAEAKAMDEEFHARRLAETEDDGN
ncbi:MAG: HEAT repeat domain-containing protein [Thermomicrobiales bacterium]